MLTGLTNDTPYTFQINAINSSGTGMQSNLVYGTPKSDVAPKFVIPSWIKVNAGWWAEGKISDAEYVQAIEYLINQKIIKIK
jgi:hypothetical protein